MYGRCTAPHRVVHCEGAANRGSHARTGRHTTWEVAKNYCGEGAVKMENVSSRFPGTCSNRPATATDGVEVLTEWPCEAFG